jgi:hypothetical protein
MPAVFASTEKTAVPVPLKLCDVNVIQGTEETAVQPWLQFEGEIVTLMVFPVVAAADTVNVRGLTVNVQF